VNANVSNTRSEAKRSKGPARGTTPRGGASSEAPTAGPDRLSALARRIEAQAIELTVYLTGPDRGFPVDHARRRTLARRYRVVLNALNARAMSEFQRMARGAA
jgi:hypothetical protein